MILLEEELNIFSKQYKDKLMEKYKNKDRLPKAKNDRIAYIYCKYTKNDISKFCNTADTKRLKSIVKGFIDDDAKDNDYEVKFLKGLEKSDSSCVHAITVSPASDSKWDIYYISTINAVCIVEKLKNGKYDVMNSTVSIEDTIKQDLESEYNRKL